MKETSATMMGMGTVPPPQSQAGSGKFGILAGLAAVQLLGLGFLGYQTYSLKQDLVTQKTVTDAELAKLRETTSVTSQTNRRIAAKLQEDLEEARRAGNVAVGQAKVEANRRAEELNRQLQSAQARQQELVAQTRTEIAAVKETATTANTKIGEVTTEVSTVKADVANSRAELDKTVANLKQVTGDLGVVSGLVATNGKELQALKQLGERNYFEFNISKSKQAQKVGDVMISLKKVDTKRNKYTVLLVADDKKMEKPDKNLNEPVQFYVAKARQPYELVVNEMRKDTIIGYLATPKVQTARN